MSRGVNSRKENDQIDQRLQKITMGKVPIPDKTIDCQTLLRQDVSHQGWLRRKKPGKLNAAFGSLLPSILWEQMFVVICKGCLYFYNSESEKKPQKAVSLFGYTRVMRASEIKMRQAGGVWPFKVAYVLDDHDRVHYLSAPCEEDMMKWLKSIKLELYKANGVEYSDDGIEDEDIHDLETPISTGNYFSEMSNLKQIKEVVEDDSDMDSDYDYIETDECISPQSQGSSSSSSSNTHSQVPHRNPAPPSSKPGKQPPPTPSKTQNKTSPQSTGYYPSSILNQSPPPIAGGKELPVPPAKKPTPNPPSKPLSKQPVVMAKEKLAKNGSGVSGGVGRDSPAKTPSGESLSSTTVADLSRALAEKMGGKTSDKVSSQASRPPTQASRLPAQGSRSPDHPTLGETKSSSVGASKPLPPIPAPSRGSNGGAPTAVVFPMKQSAANQNRFTQDLEASALWAEDAGEGQRLLMSLGVEGAFMLRCCSDGSQARTLLAIAGFQLRKYKIFVNEEGMFSLQTDFVPRFDSVHNLLNYYRTNVLPNRQTTLSQSYRELQRR